jgi:hypothetical protein
MELTGKIHGVSFSFDGKPLITLEVNERTEALAMVDELKCHEKLTVSISKPKKKRSLDANAYAWVLIGKISQKTNVPKNEVYREAIRDIGSFEIVCVKEEAAESLIRKWEHNGIGWQAETMLSKLDGCTNVMLYYGSSTYDTEQMSRLIENLIQDCNQLGIDTKSQEEIDSLINSWR